MNKYKSCELPGITKFRDSWCKLGTGMRVFVVVVVVKGCRDSVLQHERVLEMYCTIIQLYLTSQEYLLINGKDDKFLSFYFLTTIKKSSRLNRDLWSMARV